MLRHVKGMWVAVAGWPAVTRAASEDPEFLSHDVAQQVSLYRVTAAGAVVHRDFHRV